MLEFRLGSIRVTVHPSHLLVGALFGWMSLDAAPVGWPGNVLSDPSAPDRLLTQAAVIGIWVGIVFVSVLFHELGHALAMRAYHYRPSIQLVMLGGYTTPNTSEPLPWQRDVVTTLAGPFFGASLGLLCWLLLKTGPGQVLRYILTSATLANLYWAAFNMAPVLPLDGGRVTMALLARAFGKVGMALAFLLGLGLCAVALYLSWRAGVQSFLFLFALLFGFRNVQGLLTLWRSEPSAAIPPELVEAERLFGAGQIGAARSQLEALRGREVPMAIASRLHYLGGWIALREGEGRRALDHFSQVQGRPVERHALAAALSLIGDEARAIPLWEQAYGETQDPSVLQEWAGALLRAGRTDDATRLPGVDLAGAYRAAEKMVFLRGAYSEAARFGEESFNRRPSPEGAYDVACALARAGDSRRSVEFLERARALGYRDVDTAATDPDLASLHGLPAFDAWLISLGKTSGP